MRSLVKLFLSIYSQPQSLPDSRAGTFAYLPEPQFPQLWSPESSACSSRTQSPGLQFPMGKLTFAHFLTYNTAWARGPDTRDRLSPCVRKDSRAHLVSLSHVSSHRSGTRSVIPAPSQRGWWSSSQSQSKSLVKRLGLDPSLLSPSGCFLFLFSSTGWHLAPSL